MLAELILRRIGTTDWCAVNYRSTPRGPFTTLFVGNNATAGRFYSEKGWELVNQNIPHKGGVEL